MNGNTTEGSSMWKYAGDFSSGPMVMPKQESNTITDQTAGISAASFSNPACHVIFEPYTPQLGEWDNMDGDYMSKVMLDAEDVQAGPESPHMMSFTGSKPECTWATQNTPLLFPDPCSIHTQIMISCSLIIIISIKMTPIRCPACRAQRPPIPLMRPRRGGDPEKLPRLPARPILPSPLPPTMIAQGRSSVFSSFDRDEFNGLLSDPVRLICIVFIFIKVVLT